MSHYGPPSSRDDRFQGLTRLNQAGVPKALGGRGVGVALVRCDVEGACAAGLKTIPLLPLGEGADPETQGMAGRSGMSEITHNQNMMRYSYFENGIEAYLTYERPRAGQIHITHTIVPGPLGGRGLGKRLVEAAMADVIANGETVSSSCWFATALIEKTPAWSARQA